MNESKHVNKNEQAKLFSNYIKREIMKEVEQRTQINIIKFYFEGVKDYLLFYFYFEEVNELFCFGYFKLVFGFLNLIF